MQFNITKSSSAFSGYFFTLAATFLWAGNFCVARGLFEQIPPATFAFWRWVVAATFILPLAFRHTIKDWPAIKRAPFYLFFSALFGVALFSFLSYLASQTTSALNLSLISITFPIFVMFICKFLYQEKFTAMKMLGIICVLFGVVLLLTKGEFNRLIHTSFSIGDIWMLIAAMAFAIYSVLLRKKPKPISVWSFQFTTYIIGVILLFPLMLIEQKSQPAVPLNLTAAYGILYGGIFASLVGFILWNKAVIAIGPVKAGMIYYTLPIFSGGLGAVFLGEAMTVNHLYSTFLITSGILIANWKNNPPLKSIRDPHPVDSKSISIQKSR